jgi:hypothetical protein
MNLGDFMSAKEVWVFLLFIIGIVICYFLAHSAEAMDFYSVKIGDTEISYYVIEDTTRIYIEDVFDASVSNKAYYDKGLASVSLKNLGLSIQTYACYGKVGKKDCLEYYSKTTLPTLKEKETYPSSLTIMKDDTVLYEGEYMSDIRSIVTDAGRYYFIVDIEEQVFRKQKSVKLLFTVKVSE